MCQFQSTLPRGSDIASAFLFFASLKISIHAPSRERHLSSHQIAYVILFQSTLPRGSDTPQLPAALPAHRISIHAPSRERHYFMLASISSAVFQSTLPRGIDKHQNKLLLYSFKSSIFCELAQLKYSKIYFDVRKLIVSHSSLSCEPKLNFMFHITSHRIILHYFYSCQSICK